MERLWFNNIDNITYKRSSELVPAKEPTDLPVNGTGSGSYRWWLNWHGGCLEGSGPHVAGPSPCTEYTVRYFKGHDRDGGRSPCPAGFGRLGHGLDFEQGRSEYRSTPKYGVGGLRMGLSMGATRAASSHTLGSLQGPGVHIGHRLYSTTVPIQPFAI